MTKSLKLIIRGHAKSTTASWYSVEMHSNMMNYVKLQHAMNSVLWSNNDSTLCLSGIFWFLIIAIVFIQFAPFNPSIRHNYMEYIWYNTCYAGFYCNLLCCGCIIRWCRLLELRTISWRHQMETFSALLAICAGNSPVTGEFPAQMASDADLWCHLWSPPE